MSLFTYSLSEYRRNIDILPAYVEDSALFISRMLDEPIENAREFVKESIAPGGIAAIHDPDIAFLKRQKNGDREKRVTTFSKYLEVVAQQEFIMAPTMTVYLNPNQETSLLAEYISGNLKIRKEFKHKMFEAKMAGDAITESYYNGLQNSSKIKNNSVSGAHASASTILFNKSSHSTLTSTCRISTSYANANNEWFLAGNRHFWCPQVILASMVLACRHTDFDLLLKAMDEYCLVYPTADDVMDCIRYSASLYMRGEKVYEEARAFASRMNDLERAAFVYTGDLFHLAKHNPEFVRAFLDQLSTPSTDVMPKAEAEVYMKKKIDGAQQDLIVLLCADVMKGRPLYGDGGADDNSVHTNDPEAFGILGSTAKKVLETLEEYRPLVHGLWRPSILPPSIAVLPSIMRRVVVTSDTDSTIFTNQHWTEWFTNGDSFCEKAYQIGYTTTYLTSQLVKHKLALMSANIGCIQDHLHKISMKNEYYFPVFALTPVAKHYYAFRSAQEGRVFAKMETEIKGVHLRDSSAPAEVTKMLKRYMEDIMTGAMQRGGLTMEEVFGPIAELELTITEDLRRGHWRFMKMAQIKDLNSYVKKEEASVYKHHLFWDEVFGPKYGFAGDPPYQAVKVSVDLESKPKIGQWLKEMEDREMADRLSKWVKAEEKTKITTFYLPLQVIQSTGIPKEIMDAMNVRKLVMNIVKPFYLVLASTGIYVLDKHMSRMISDTYIPVSRRSTETANTDDIPAIPDAA